MAEKKEKCYNCHGKFPVSTMRKLTIAALRDKWTCRDTMACLERVQKQAGR